MKALKIALILIGLIVLSQMAFADQICSIDGCPRGDYSSKYYSSGYDSTNYYDSSNYYNSTYYYSQYVPTYYYSAYPSYYYPYYYPYYYGPYSYSYYYPSYSYNPSYYRPSIRYDSDSLHIVYYG